MSLLLERILPLFYRIPKSLFYRNHESLFYRIPESLFYRIPESLQDPWPLFYRIPESRFTGSLCPCFIESLNPWVPVLQDPWVPVLQDPWVPVLQDPWVPVLKAGTRSSCHVFEQIPFFISLQYLRARWKILTIFIIYNPEIFLKPAVTFFFQNGGLKVWFGWPAARWATFSSRSRHIF